MLRNIRESPLTSRSQTFQKPLFVWSGWFWLKKRYRLWFLNVFEALNPVLILFEFRSTKPFRNLMGSWSFLFEVRQIPNRDAIANDAKFSYSTSDDSELHGAESHSVQIINDQIKPCHTVAQLSRNCAFSRLRIFRHDGGNARNIVSSLVFCTSGRERVRTLLSVSLTLQGRSNTI